MTGRHPLIHCKNCGKAFRNAIYPIRCHCGAVTNGNEEVSFPNNLDYSYAENPWVVIHSKLADCIHSGLWDPKEIQRWYENEWIPSIPGCGSCRTRWSELTKRFPINWTDAKSAYRCLIDLHNLVSTQHANKPAISHQQADEIYLWQPSLDDCFVAVTALSLLPNHRFVQSRVLDSWKRFGLTIHSVNTVSEIEQLTLIYPQVDQWHESDGILSKYARPTQRINSLANIAIKLSHPILLINSDIEIHGPQSMVREPHAAGRVIVGIRHNYRNHWWADSSRFVWGVDAFAITPELARSLPESPLEIGRPMWDYWLPYHCKLYGSAMEWIGEPLFYHREHPINWSSSDWKIGADWIEKQYGISISKESTREFRDQFPYGPSWQQSLHVQ